MRFDLATVLRATGARVAHFHGGGLELDSIGTADLERPLSDVTTDSRLVVRDGLFVALQGERSDGHRFVRAAFEAGAGACIVSRLPQPGELSGLPSLPHLYLFLVPDPLVALQRLATYWRQQSPAEVIGITGSVGKTTTKEIVASLLGQKFSVLKSEANLNTEIGLPLMLLRLRSAHQVAVLEMGMYVPGDIGLLADIARPRLGIVTNVAPIHLERAGSIERIARGKSELVAHLPPDGLAILNGDNDWTRAMALTSGVARTVLVGTAKDCDYRAEKVRALGLDGVALTLHAEERSIPLRTAVPGVHTVHAVLTAAAVARELGMTWEEISASIGLVRLDVRQRILQSPGMLIIDDSYNAAPMSVNAALELLRESPGTKIAVLGDMLELGPEEEAAHRIVGERAAAVADWLIVRGTRSVWIADEAERSGMPLERVRRVADNQSAVAAVQEIVTEGQEIGGAGSSGRWSVLVKGSRGMRMEEVVQALRGEG